MMNSEMEMDWHNQMETSLSPPNTTASAASTIIGLNNEAVRYFVCGDWEQAIILSQIAFEVFSAHRQDNPLEQNIHLPIPPSNLNNNNFRNLMLSSAHPYLCHPEAIPFGNPTPPTVPIATNSNSSSSSSNNNNNVHTTVPTNTANESLQYTVSEAFLKVASLRERIVSEQNPHHHQQQQQQHHNLSSVQALHSGCSSSSATTAAYCIYNRALMLPEGQHEEQQLLDGHDASRKTCAILLYNLGLVYHNVGVYLGISSALWHSLRLYELAIESIDAVPGSWKNMEKLVMALLNNMGNIHAHLFHEENTNACMKNLRIVLAASRSSSSSSFGGETALDEDYLFFFLNALFQAKQLNFAPAA